MTDRPQDYSWVTRNDINVVARRLNSIRRGVPGKIPPNPVVAIEVIQMFAHARKVKDLLELEPDYGSSDNFDRLDATAILALAALTRPVQEAAGLAIERWKKESAVNPAQTRITDSIVHDITAQRTVAEVTDILTQFWEGRKSELVTKTLDAFIGPGSNRSGIDKALLYFKLRASKAAGIAPEVLDLIMREAGTSPAARAPLDGIVAAIRHLSPSETIVERWIDEKLKKPDDVSQIIDLVATLLIDDPEGARPLAEHIGRKWNHYRLRDLCRRLNDKSAEGLRPADGDDPAEKCFAMVLRYAAERPDAASLAEIIKSWHDYDPLREVFPGLLAEIVTTGPDGSSGPRSIPDLDALCQHLENDDAPQACVQQLRIAIAKHVVGRTGDQIAQELGKIEPRKELIYTAQIVNKTLRTNLHERNVGEFVNYLRALQKVPGRGKSSALIFWAVRELSEPQASGGAAAKISDLVADIAIQLYLLNSLRPIGFDLLERCLENEQAMSLETAVTIMKKVRVSDVGMATDDQWLSLLGATIGRWAQGNSRQAIIDKLGALGFHVEIDAMRQAVY